MLCVPTTAFVHRLTNCTLGASLGGDINHGDVAQSFTRHCQYGFGERFLGILTQGLGQLPGVHFSTFQQTYKVLVRLNQWCTQLPPNIWFGGDVVYSFDNVSSTLGGNCCNSLFQSAVTRNHGISDCSNVRFHLVIGFFSHALQCVQRGRRSQGLHRVIRQSLERGQVCSAWVSFSGQVQLLGYSCSIFIEGSTHFSFGSLNLSNICLGHDVGAAFCCVLTNCSHLAQVVQLVSVRSAGNVTDSVQLFSKGLWPAQCFTLGLGFHSFDDFCHARLDCGSILRIGHQFGNTHQCFIQHVRHCCRCAVIQHGVEGCLVQLAANLRHVVQVYTQSIVHVQCFHDGVHRRSNCRVAGVNACNKWHNAWVRSLSTLTRHTRTTSGNDGAIGGNRLNGLTKSDLRHIRLRAIKTLYSLGHVHPSFWLLAHLRQGSLKHRRNIAQDFTHFGLLCARQCTQWLHLAILLTARHIR